MKRKIKFLVLAFGILALFSIANTSLAQAQTIDEYGVDQVGDELDGRLGENRDVRITVVRFIQIGLTFLGVIAVVIILYAGFLWMTSGGNEEKISKAKKILINAVIGLVIILSAWTITAYLINKISGITSQGGSGGNNVYNVSPSGFYNSGAGAIGVCSVQSTYPEDGQRNVPRNTSIMITFKEELDLNSVCINEAGDSCLCNNDDCSKLNPEVIKIFKSEMGDACIGGTCPSENNTNVHNVIVSVTSNKKTLVLSPIDYLGSSDGHTPYTVNFTNKIKKADGNSIFRGCNNDYLEIKFTVSNILDLTPPQIISGGIFPPTDNEIDYIGEDVPAEAATSKIEVIACPQKYSPAKVISVSGQDNEATIGDYSGPISKFNVSIAAGSNDRAQLFNAQNGALLGIGQFQNNEVYFPDFDLSLKVDSYEEGSFWEIEIKTEKLADSLRVNSEVYTFSDSNVNNNIKVVENCDSQNNDQLEEQAFNIKAVISGNSDIEILDSENAQTINIKAKVAGEAGNNLALEFKDSNALRITPFTGGINSESTSEIKDKEDKPRNSAIQISFNEEINPITVSGTAEEVSQAIRLINFNPNAVQSGSQCSANSDCLSYNCDNSICVGDYVKGSFSISSDYRTVEFLSDNECGINGCGEKIYCLPANSHLKVEVRAANLKNCSSNNNCASFSPYSVCTNSGLSYNTCQDSDGNNYPLSNLSNLDGVVDAALNSFDGNRDDFSAGPITFFNENNPNIENGDNYFWSFFISNDIKLTPPRLISVTPGQGSEGVVPGENIEVKFNTLMLNNTLKSGDVEVQSGNKVFNHKYVNLKSLTPASFGFWIKSDNLDLEPMDGQPDITIASIKHTPLPESMTFYAQIGSGVRDIYQNCYKPAIGPACPSTDASCCFGQGVIELDGSGNCIVN